MMHRPNRAATGLLLIVGLATACLAEGIAMPVRARRITTAPATGQPPTQLALVIGAILGSPEFQRR